MLIKSDFEVAAPVEKVWQFFDNIPQVAACLPGAELTEDLGEPRLAGSDLGGEGEHVARAGAARAGAGRP